MADAEQFSDPHLREALGSNYGLQSGDKLSLEQVSFSIWHTQISEHIAAVVAGRRSGGKRSAAAEAACARAEALHEAQGRVANAIINLPAATLLGAAYKLIVWRKEAAISFPNDFDGAHESFTFSAYRDLLRLTGLNALEHPHDRATLARMKKYWSLS